MVVAANSRSTKDGRAREGHWIDRRTYRAGSQEYLTDRGRAEQFPYTTSRDFHLNAPSRFLFDKLGRRRPIKSMEVEQSPFVRNNYEDVRVCLKKDLAEINERKDPKNQPEKEAVMERNGGHPVRRWVLKNVHTERGRRYMTEPQACQHFGIERRFFGYWASKKSRRRPSPALRPLAVSNNPIAQQGSRGDINRWDEQDIADILDGKESKGPGSGRGPNAESLRRTRLAAAEQAILDLFGSGRDLPPSEVFAQAKERFGVSAHYVRQAFRRYEADRSKARGISLNFGECLPVLPPSRGLMAGASLAGCHQHKPKPIAELIAPRTLAAARAPS